jgi:hypothetical protein
MVILDFFLFLYCGCIVSRIAYLTENSVLKLELESQTTSLWNVDIG